MLNEICTILAAAFLVSFVSMKCCIYTAITAYLILSTLGLSPVYCWGEVSGEDSYHAWVRVGSHDIEQSTFNLYHAETVNYGGPDATFNTTSDFINAMDMLSPIRQFVPEPIAETEMVTVVYENESVQQIITHTPIYIVDDWDNLTTFIANDSTDERPYIMGEYDCKDFSIDLAINLTAAGWKVGVVRKSNKYGHGHMLVWVIAREPYYKFYIEPQLDEIYNPETYLNGSDESVFTDISIGGACRNRYDMRRWYG